MTIELPELDERITWSVQAVDADSGAVLAESGAATVCETASVGKLFLLIEVARRLLAGDLRASDRIEIPDSLRVADSGLLYRMHDQRLTVYDAALLVGAVSDNLATNALIHLCGLAEVRAVAPSLGYEHTTLLDYIRNERTPDLPWTPSYGCAVELSDLMRRLGAGEIVSRAVSELVLTWLAANVDTSMVADAFLLDPLAHVEPEFEGMVLRHKTGSTSFARIDTGLLRGPAAGVAYAVAANWKDSPEDLREPALEAMHAFGARLREYVVTGR